MASVGTMYCTDSCHLFCAYSDVFVLTTDPRKLQDDKRDDAGHMTSPASGFVLGLGEYRPCDITS